MSVVGCCAALLVLSIDQEGEQLPPLILGVGEEVAVDGGRGLLMPLVYVFIGPSCTTGVSKRVISCWIE